MKDIANSSKKSVLPGKDVPLSPEENFPLSSEEIFPEKLKKPSLSLIFAQEKRLQINDCAMRNNLAQGKDYGRDEKKNSKPAKIRKNI